MKLSIAISAALFALSALCVPGQVKADIKKYHGSDCKVFGSTAWTDLAFSGYGVKNLQSSARQVICPLLQDQETYWNTNNAAIARIHVETGSVPAPITCTAYVTSNDPAVTAVNTSTHQFGMMPANTADSSYLFSLVSVGLSNIDDKAYMLCTLGPQARLKGYYLLEFEATGT